MGLLMTEERIYTVREVAERLRVHPKTVRKLIARGELMSFKVLGEYRIKQGALDQFMREKTQDQQP